MTIEFLDSPTTYKRARSSINANFTALFNAVAGPGAIDATDPAVTALLTDNGSGAYTAVEGIVEDVADDVVEGLVTSPSATRTVMDGRYTRITERPISATEAGAVPDGTTDNSGVLGDLMGREVHFLPGTYLFNTRPQLSAGTRWRGEGATLLAGTTTNFAGFLTLNDDTHLSGFTIEGDETAYYCIHTIGENVTVQDVEVRNSLHHGVFTAGGSGAANVSYTRVKAIDCGRSPNNTAVGFYASQVPVLSYTDCYASGSFQQGWYVAGANGHATRMNGCVAENNGNWGIDVRTPGSTINGCCAFGNTRGGLAIQLADTGVDADEITVSGGVYSRNIESDTGTYEVTIYSANRVNLTGVIVVAGGGSPMPSGIAIKSADGVTVTGCQVEGYALSGIDIAALGGVGCTDVMVTGSRIKNAGSGNAIIASTVNGLTVTGNRIQNAANGVRLVGVVDDAWIGPNHFTSVTNRLSDATSGGTGRRNLLNTAIAASPGTATGTDAAVINAVITALRNNGIVT